MVLIDTPGVGSTYRHNTTAAEGVLPECDAALFVVSHDPPITEVELRYLGEVCKSVSHVVVVLNKVDLIGEDDRERVLSFLRTVLAETHLPQMDPNIFPVSAKAALDARLHDKPAEIAHSGLGGLESYVRQRLMRQKAELLEVSALQNIQTCISELRIDVDLNRHALALPIEKLDENIAIFESAVEGLQSELQSLDDLLTGEWRRSLALLDEIALSGERLIEARWHSSRRGIRGTSAVDARSRHV
jgi:tRNA U34 5-carboxymethylaminomethyl modifying GTPase MnmE/TrmE